MRLRLAAREGLPNVEVSGGRGCLSSHTSTARFSLVRSNATPRRRAPQPTPPATPAQQVRRRSRHTASSAPSRCPSHPTGHRSFIHLPPPAGRPDLPPTAWMGSWMEVESGLAHLSYPAASNEERLQPEALVHLSC